ncbi:hypothetical protein FACS1894211_05400 [Clostridia bacterium]|nr:hypothetical protein FACS1894211_05400 [Clostridia bacterium]
MNIVELKNVSYTYRGETPVKAVKNVSLEIGEGGFVALCGHNGSGKSTLARLMNGLLTPDGGDVTVGGIPLGGEKKTETVNGVEMSYEKRLYEIRRNLGIVFQNPDNQTVAAIIEDDIAFGPENIGVPTAEIRERVDAALKSVGMSDYAEKTASRLSGGQKQRVAIAGILALKPRVIVLDESTAMLDPKGRAEVLDTVRRLNRDEGITIVLITHFMEEALLADKIYIMNEGEICLSGGREIFWTERAKLKEIGLKTPPAAELAEALRQAGVPVGREVCGEAELEQSLAELFSGQWTVVNDQLEGDSKGQIKDSGQLEGKPDHCPLTTDHCSLPVVIDQRELSFSYSPDTAFRADALKEVTLTVREGDFLGVIGHTGSGKSTLVQHWNGLIKMQIPKRKQRRRGAKQGTLFVLGLDLSRKDYGAPKRREGQGRGRKTEKGLPAYKALRSAVGMVFQYPEYQLFDETVLKDVGFGPRNLKLPPEEIAERCKWAIEAVGLDYEKVKDMSPFELSGGQKRRAAIAGVIAMKPRVLILDEPTAGLDPQGRGEIMDLILKLKAESCPTVVMVSHDMDEIARRCSRIAVLNGGRLEFDLPPPELYGAHADRLTEIGLDLPLTARLVRALRKRGIELPQGICKEDDFVAEAAKRLKR